MRLRNFYNDDYDHLYDNDDYHLPDLPQPLALPPPTYTTIPFIAQFATGSDLLSGVTF